MKKIAVFGFAFVLAFTGFIKHSYAADVAVVCDYPDHAIYNEANTMKVGCISQSDWQAAALVNSNSVNGFVSMRPGQRLLTSYGFEDTCPIWFPAAGCVIAKSLFVRFL